MWHLSGFCQSVNQCLAAGKELIFVSRNLLGHIYGLDVDTVGSMHGDGLRIVNVVDNKIAFGSSDDTDVVSYA